MRGLKAVESHSVTNVPQENCELYILLSNPRGAMQRDFYQILTTQFLSVQMQERRGFQLLAMYLLL